jgi:hypothetical protein
MDAHRTRSSSDTDQRIAALEKRVRELEDDRAIRELLARYGYNADLGCSDAWVDLFTPDGAFDVAALKYADGHASLRADVIVRHEGHDALRAFILDPSSHKAIECRSLHVMDCNLRTRIAGNTATAESYNLTLVREGARTILFNASINRWTLRKMDGRWRVEECMRRRPAAPGFDRVLLPDRSDEELAT